MKWRFYKDGTSFVDKLNNLTEMKILNQIVVRANKDTLLWFHTEEERLKICAAARISEITFKRYVPGLVKAKILLKKGRGAYMLNSEFIDYGKHEKT